MNARHRQTLGALFAGPVPRTLEWRSIEALLVGAGSRVTFKRDGLRADFHRPHPGKDAKPYQVRMAREFLETLGVRP